MRTNLAFNKIATASSEYSSTYSAVKGNDGNETTRWAAGSDTPAGEWWKVDLGSAQNIEGVRIKFEMASASSSKAYQVGLLLSRLRRLKKCITRKYTL